VAQEQVQRQKSTTRTEESQPEQAPAAANTELAAKTDQVVADIDDVLEEQLDTELLDAIDDVLEENAEQFIAEYVQQGGQ